jgi:quercetin dioxygenase-like cupin family protein
MIEIDENNWIESRGYLKNVLLMGDDLECEGALVQVIIIPPNSQIPDHYHKTSREFYIVLGGESTIKVDNTERVLRPGDMLFTEPGDVHRLRNDSENEFELLVFKTNAGKDDTFWVKDRAI